jgi:hypothetical protein
MSCPVGGCSNNPTPLWPNENLARAVAADGFNVYWTTADPMAGTIRQAPVNDAGPDGSAITLANAESSPISIAVDETYVYWYDWSTTGCSIMRCNIGGCGGKPTKIADVMGNGFTVGSVAVRNGDVYWTSGYNSGGDQIQWCPKGQVCQTDAGGSAPKVLANVNMPIALTTDSVNVYWSTNGSVQSCQLKGSCGNAWSEIANAQGFVRSVAVDAKYVYWSSDSKNIYYCLKGTDCVGAGTLLTGTGTGPDSLVIDRTSLFWTSNDNSTDGGVWTFNPKPN